MFAECDEFSLRIIVSIASGTHSLTEIAAKTQIPSTQLPALLDLLQQCQLIECKNELFQLLISTDELSLYDVLNRVNTWNRWSNCPLSVDDHANELCPLHRRLENISSLVERQLRATSIESIISDPSQSKPLCNKL